MGDLVLLQEEVSPVLSALLDHGIDVTALHNHFSWEEPHGDVAMLESELTPVLSCLSSVRPRKSVT